LLYQRGAFDGTAVQSTATALLYLSLGLYFRALNFVGGRVFLARQRLFFPVVFSAFGLAVHLGLNLVLVPRWQLAGVALSLTFVEIVVATLYYAKLRWDLGPLGGRQIAVSLAKMGLAAVLMAAALAPLNVILGMHVSSLWVSGIVLLVGGGVGGVIYVGVLWLLRLEELRTIFEAGRAFLGRHLGWSVLGADESGRAGSG
jgi:peptidoglycan biosynthesis protein MviN/MurJ (putative lipid II flippase)